MTGLTDLTARLREAGKSGCMPRSPCGGGFLFIEAATALEAVIADPLYTHLMTQSTARLQAVRELEAKVKELEAENRHLESSISEISER